MRKISVALVLATFTVGCGDDGSDGNGGESATIATGAVTGKVGGQPWTLATAQVDAFLSDQNFWVDLSAEALASCNDFGSGNALILTVPKNVGTYSLSLMLNGTFVVEGGAQTENLIATQGSLRVDEVTSALVRGGVNMTYDADNSVSGEFEAIVCE
jgi:hypothetical protein